MIKAVLFDRDGVIIDSEATNITAGINVFVKMGVDISEEDKLQIIGRHPIDYMGYFQEKYNFSEEDFLEKQRKEYYKLFPSVEIFTSMITVIKEIEEAKYKVALTTTAHLDSTTNILNKTGLNEIFDVVVTFEDCPRRKPAPDPYLITAKKLGVKPEECLVIEDSLAGLQSAQSAGMRCIIIKREHNKDSDFSNADFVIAEAGDIIKIIKADMG